MNMSIKQMRYGLLLSVATTALGLPVGASAQVVDEITVTAQKKEQSLQSVPFSVSATTGERLDELRINDPLDLQNVTPSLQSPSTGAPGQGASFRLRGFGSPPFQLGIEPAVATYVDNVYRSRTGVAVNDLVDIDRIEVLKGPQGTLFGKNTTAGVVHIVTEKPVIGEFGGFLEGSYEEYERYRVRGAVNIPLGDRAAARISGSWADGEGSIENAGPGPNQNDLGRKNIRVQIYAEPTDNFDIRVIGSYSNIDEVCCAAVRLADGPFTGPLTFFANSIGYTVISPPDTEERITSVNEDVFNKAEEYGISAEANWQFGQDLTLTSITSYHDFENTGLSDGDFIGADLLAIGSDIGISTFTQELRLAGEIDAGLTDSINWIVGAYYTHEEIDRLRTFNWKSQVGFYFPPFTSPAPGLGVVDTLGQEADSYALFLNLEVPLTERLLFTGGFRYNIERKNGFGTFDQPNPIVLTVVNPSFVAEVSEEEPTWSTSLQYQWTDSIMTYFQYARGYKAGGINLAREASGALGSPNEATFLPETVDHLEVGAKTQLFDNRVRLNAALFRDDYKDLQNQIFMPPLFIVRNGEGALIQGFEVEGDIAVADGIDLFFGVIGLDSEFDAGTDLGAGDVGGQPLGWAPKWSGSVGWSIKKPLGDTGFDAFTSGSLLMRSSYRANTAPGVGTTQGATEILNTRVGLAAGDGRYELSIWCRNCLNETYSEVIFDSPVDFFPGMGAAVETYLGRPRETGVSLRVNF